MKTVILTPDLIGPTHNGGIGTFVYHFGRLLRQHNEDVSIVFTGHVHYPRRQWMHHYDSSGIPVIISKEPTIFDSAQGNWEFVRRSTIATAYIPPDTDILYLQGWLADGFHTIRTRRYRDSKRPITATVLHSSSRWSQMGMGIPPLNVAEMLSMDFAERYTAQHSDVILSPSRYMLEWSKQWGWQLPDEQHVLGLPFHPMTPINTPASIIHEPIKHLIFFGRQETRKGLELFVDALAELAKYHPQSLQAVEEIVLLGKSGVNRLGTSAEICATIQQQTGKAIRSINNLDSAAAQAFLAQHAATALVVIPSLVDNFPYAVIEAISIPELRVIAAATGGIPEILPDATMTFAPSKQGLVNALNQHLNTPQFLPAQYDWAQANQHWLTIHDQLKQRVKQLHPIPRPILPAVDVCVTHYNLGKYLLQALATLNQQTYQQMNVIVIDDASTDSPSRVAFEQAKQQYQARGWLFIQLPENKGPSEARNIAAHHSHADYLIFLDADNIPLPQMVERYVESIHHSGDDCLTCYMETFNGDENPLERNPTASLRRHLPGITRYMPLGADITQGMIANIFGDTTMIIRRDVFVKIGGFQINSESDRYASYEDYVLLTRLCLSGYKLDVVPEVLYYYRVRDDSRMRNARIYQTMLRVQHLYRDALLPINLAQLAPTVWELSQQQQKLTTESQYDPHWIANHIPFYILVRAIWQKIKKYLPLTR